MAKFNVEVINGQTIIKCKLEWLEQIRTDDVDVFNEQIIRGLLKPTLKGFRTVEYYVPSGISLQTYLKKGLMKEDFFNIVVQIVELLKKISNGGLTVDNLQLGLDYTFINENTKEVYFVYLPVKDSKKNINVAAFISDMAYSTVFQRNEDVGFINEMVKYLSNMHELSVKQIEQYIYSVFPEIYDHLELNPQISSHELPKQVNSVEINKAEYFEKYVYQEAPFAPQELVNIQSNSSNSVQGVEDDDEPTIFLEEENTVFLDDVETEAVINKFEKLVYMIRIKTCDRIDINQAEFLIGKDATRVDYPIYDNNTISRVHAELSCFEGRYYVSDKGSTNGTYVNEEAVEVGKPREIVNGDEIMIANERFEFHIEEIM